MSAANTGRNKTGPQQAVTPPPPPVQFDSPEQANTVINAQLTHHAQHGKEAVRLEGEVDRIDAQIAAAQHQIDKLRQQVDDLMDQRQRTDLAARNQRGAENGFARAIAAMGAPTPAPAVAPPAGAVPVWPQDGQTPIEQAVRAGFEPYQPQGPNGTQHLPDPEGPLAKFNEFHDAQDAVEGGVAR